MEFSQRQIIVYFCAGILAVIGYLNSPTQTRRIMAEIQCKKSHESAGKELEECEKNVKSIRTTGSIRTFQMGRFILHIPSQYLLGYDAEIKRVNSVSINFLYPELTPLYYDSRQAERDRMVSTRLYNNGKCEPEYCDAFAQMRYEKQIIFVESERNQKNKTIAFVQEHPETGMSEYTASNEGTTYKVFVKGPVEKPVDWVFCSLVKEQEVCHTIYRYHDFLWIQVIFPAEYMKDFYTFRDRINQWYGGIITEIKDKN